MLKHVLNPQFRIWLAIVGTGTLVLGGAYTMVQQATRQAANDWPRTTIQLVKKQLEAGGSPGEVVTSATEAPADLRQDLHGFVIVTDNSHGVLASSASLDGQTPLPPEGVFAYTAAHGTDRISWQPKDDVRLATVLSSYKSTQNSGFILAGQSLKLYEERVDIYGVLALAAWAAMFGWATLILLLPAKFLPDPKRRRR